MPSIQEKSTNSTRCSYRMDPDVEDRALRDLANALENELQKNRLNKDFSRALLLAIALCRATDEIKSSEPKIDQLILALDLEINSSYNKPPPSDSYKNGLKIAINLISDLEYRIPPYGRDRWL